MKTEQRRAIMSSSRPSASSCGICTRRRNVKGVNETSTKVLRTAKIQTDLLCCSGGAVYERLTGDISVFGLINLCFFLQEIKSVGQDESMTESRHETVLKRSPSSALSLEEVGFLNRGLSCKSN